MQCGACNTEIATCEQCGGKLCVPGCKDREKDGCTCALDVDNRGDEKAAD